ncbi:MAG: iron-containing alcohol dehydrogenase [Desulfobacteraceae bacterium]|nr:MAG: iron-containing alcohol dehydrogenase [Desulfobacteraceae bacterium]
MADTQINLRKFVAPEFIFGIDARCLAGRYAQNFGASKVLIVSDPGVIAAGWTKEMTEGLESAKIPFHVFSAVTPNPKAEEVMRGAEEYEKEGCDAIVAVGGGSPMDCAKGIGIVSTNKKHILEFEGVDQVSEPGPPLICVPTTAGSSADVSQFAIITDMQRRVKITIISKTLVPDVSLVDPLTLTTVSRDLAAYTGMDALTHALEAFVSNAASPITDLFALEGIRLMASSLVPSLEHPEDRELRTRTMLASLYAGLAFSNASLGLVHAMAHSLGGYSDIAHGQSNAILVSHVVGFNFEMAEEKYQAIGELLGVEEMSGLRSEEKKEALLAALGRVKKAINLDVNLRALGVKQEEIPRLAENAMSDPCIATNPRRPTKDEIERLYEQALL